MAKGLIPILEPEVNIKATDKSECEAILRAELHENVSANPFYNDFCLFYRYTSLIIVAAQ